MNREGKPVEHAKRFAVYRQVSAAVAFDVYISDREIASATGFSVDSVGQYLIILRRSFPTLLAEFDAIRHNSGERRVKNSPDVPQALDEIFA